MPQWLDGVRAARYHRDEDLNSLETAYSGRARLEAKKEARGAMGWLPGEYTKFYETPISTASQYYHQIIS